MRKGLITIVFMIIVTSVFISTLAYVNEASRDRIARNVKIQDVRSLMYACDIHPQDYLERLSPGSSTTADIPWDEADLLIQSDTRTKQVRLPVSNENRNLLKNSSLSVTDSVQIILINDEEGNFESYGFFLRGKGLWGTISAVAVISRDLTPMIGIDFTQQVETPGLGARIVEKTFKMHFRNLDLSAFVEDPTLTPPITLVRQKDDLKANSGNSIQAITGATQTCHGVLNMVNTDLRFYISVLLDNESELQQIIRPAGILN